MSECRKTLNAAAIRHDWRGFPAFICPDADLSTNSSMPRPILATIHTAAFAHNLAGVRAAAPDARVWAIVKANAYGHGIERAFEGLRSADGFALLDLTEAQRLRALDWRGPILLLEGCFDARDLELCSRLGLWHVIHCNEQIDMLAAHKTQVPHRVFFEDELRHEPPWLQA